MINNSSPGRWERLSQKQLDTQFRNEIMQGLQCSPFEAGGILEAVYRVYSPLFETSGSLKPGQILMQVVSAQAGASTPLSRCPEVTVTLTLDGGAEDLEVRRSEGVEGLRRHRLQRMAVEAFQQGGLLTLEDLAFRLLNCGVRTLCRDLAVLRRRGVTLALRSTVKDMGRSISHREEIIRGWLRGREYSEVGRDTCHSVAAVQSYVSKFKRAVALIEAGYDVVAVGFLVKLSPSLVESYYHLWRDSEVVSHRRRELETFLKKGDPSPQEVEI